MFARGGVPRETRVSGGLLMTLRRTALSAAALAAAILVGSGAAIAPAVARPTAAGPAAGTDRVIAKQAGAGGTGGAVAAHDVEAPSARLPGLRPGRHPLDPARSAAAPPRPSANSTGGRRGGPPVPPRPAGCPRPGGSSPWAAPSPAPGSWRPPPGRWGARAGPPSPAARRAATS